MIYLKENSENIICLTLSEHSNGYEDINNYIVKMFNKQTQEDRYILLNGDNNLSLNKYRFDKYLVELTSKQAQDVLNASIHLSNEEYSYFIVITNEYNFSDENDLKNKFNEIYEEDRYSIISSGLIKVKRDANLDKKVSYNTEAKRVAYKK